MLIADLRQRLRALGANPAHESRVLRHWLQCLPIDGGNSGKRPLQGWLPKAVWEALPGLMAASSASSWRCRSNSRLKSGPVTTPRTYCRAMSAG